MLEISLLLLTVIKHQLQTAENLKSHFDNPLFPPQPKFLVKISLSEDMLSSV